MPRSEGGSLSVSFEIAVDTAGSRKDMSSFGRALVACLSDAVMIGLQPCTPTGATRVKVAPLCPMNAAVSSCTAPRQRSLEVTSVPSLPPVKSSSKREIGTSGMPSKRFTSAPPAPVLTLPRRLRSTSPWSWTSTPGRGLPGTWIR